MKLIYDGKTKTVYDLENGYYQLFFKDDLTGKDGVFDPGACTVGLTVEGAGRAGLKVSDYFFRLLNGAGCATHFVDADINAGTMTVKPAKHIGEGLEIICRYVAMGSFVRRYGLYVKEGDPLNCVVEVTLKDDERGDPLIVQEALEALGILKPGEYESLVAQTKKICETVRQDLTSKGMQLCDIKLEFGRDKDGAVMLIDEFSASVLRAMENGKIIEPLDLPKKLLG